MKTIILSGGQGLRLRSVVADVPKSMAPVGGRPFLEYLILQLVKWNQKDIVISVGYRSEAIMSFFNDGRKWGAGIQYSCEEEPLGTAGAIKKAFSLVKEEEALIMNGDSFLDLDFSDFFAHHKEHNAYGTIALTKVDERGRYGAVECDRTGRITAFSEKGSSQKGSISGGIYLFRRSLIDEIPAGRSSLEYEILPALVSRAIYGYSCLGCFVDIGLPEDFLKLCKHPERLTHSVL